MCCVTTVSFRISHGSNLSMPIYPNRGIRQGDPLSPYLFILCAEGLTTLLRRWESLGLVHGCKFPKNSPMISSLLFADDSLLFFRASTREAESMKHVLQVYENASYQAINYRKSSIIFSVNTTPMARRSACDILHVKAWHMTIIWVCWSK